MFLGGRNPASGSWQGNRSYNWTKEHLRMFFFYTKPSKKTSIPIYSGVLVSFDLIISRIILLN